MNEVTYMNGPQSTETAKHEIMSPSPPPRPTTANQAASMVFPEVGQVFNAFWEREESDFNQAPSIEILDLNDEFWALTLGPRGRPKDPTVWVPGENQFRRFNPAMGTMRTW